MAGAIGSAAAARAGRSASARAAPASASGRRAARPKPRCHVAAPRPASSARAAEVPLVNDLLGAKAVPSLVLSYLDAHRCPGWQDWTRNGAEVLLGPIPSSDQMHLWINVMPEQTELLFRIPDTQDCRDWIGRVVHRMQDQLIQIDRDRATGAQNRATR